MRTGLRCISALCFSVFASLALTGCSAALHPAALTASPAATPIGPLTGQVMGGRQPIIGAHIFLFAASTTGYGGKGLAASTGNASMSLLTSVTGNPADPTLGYYVTTNSVGKFSITGDYMCTPGTQVYLYSVGGDPGIGSTNTAATLTALLGACPASQTLSSAFPYVNMNELSTIAADYAAAGFTTDAVHIGTTGSSLAQTGLQSAFANSAQMYEIDGFYTSTNGNTTARATTPGTGTNGGTGTVPQAELNTLANLLAACVNSAGSGSGACAALFTNATADGTTNGTQPTDTATAAINIAHNPSAFVANLYNYAPATGAPYQPTLTSSPNDWTVQITYTSTNLQSTNTGGGPLPHSLAIDGNGKIWIANVNSSGSNTNGQLQGFSPLGVPLATGGYSVGAYYRTNVAVDAASANVWVTSKYGSDVKKFNIAAATTTAFTATGSSSPNITDTEFDGSGNLWLTDKTNNALLEMNSAGTQTATITGNSVSNPSGVALEPGTAGNVWVTNLYGPLMSSFTNAGAAYTTATTTHSNAYAGAAVDANGYIWNAADGGGLFKTPATGGAASYFAIGGGTDGLGIDGAGNVWFADRNNQRIFETSNAGTLLTGSTGITVPTYGGNTNNPNSLAVDGSGNVWFDSFNEPTLSELIGAAVPVVTPVAYGVANSTLGTRP